MHFLCQDWNKANIDKLFLNDRHPETIKFFQPQLSKNSSEVLQILSNRVAV